MARPVSRHPTELELQILKILWRDGECSVQDVRAALAADEHRSLARTSVVTTLNVMTDKKLLDRGLKGKAYFYTSLVSQEEVSTNMLKDLVHRVFDGSAEAMVLSLLESEQVDEEEHKALRRLINKKRSGGRR